MESRIAIGRVESSPIQYGWWKAGGPPYFERPRLEDVVRVREYLLDHRVTSDTAPSYGKGLSEMFMWMGYSYLEEWWLKTGRTTRRADDVVFTKCGLFWPAETRQNTHGDMYRCPDLAIGKPPADVTPGDIHDLILREFEASCTRMHVDYIHGFMLHWPFRKSDPGRPELWLSEGPFADDWMAEGVIPAFCELFAEGRIGAAGFSNIGLDLLKLVADRADEEARRRGVPDFGVHFIQNQCSLLEADQADTLAAGPMADFCRDRGIVRIAFSSLGHGSPIAPEGPFAPVEGGLSRDVQLRIHEHKKRSHDRLAALAGRAGCSAQQLALAWVLGRGLVPIFSSMSPGHVEGNLKAGHYVEAAAELSGEIEAFAADYRNEFIRCLT
jgi:aryl-alcohol dehydrogenase-like predicted oxidoreductase